MKVFLIIGEFHPPWIDGKLSYAKGFVSSLLQISSLEVTIFSTINHHWLSYSTATDLKRFYEIRDRCKIIYGLKCFTRHPIHPVRIMASLKPFKEDIIESNLLHIDYADVASSILPYFIGLSPLKGKVIVKHVGVPATNLLGRFRGLFFYEYLQKCYQHVFRSLIACTSRYVANTFGFRKGVVIQPAVDIETLSPFSEFKEGNLIGKPGINTMHSSVVCGDYRLLYFGRLSPNRFPFVKVLRTVQQLNKLYGLNVQLLVIGLGSYSERLYAAKMVDHARRLAIVGHVYIGFGMLDEVQKAALIQSADVVIFPCADNNLKGILDPPLTILESMSCGKPVISTPVGSIPTFITNRHNGFLLRDLDPNAMAKALSEVLSHKILRQAGNEARQTITEKFSPSAVAKNLEDLYKHYA